jgi:hypothetical protein
MTLSPECEVAGGGPNLTANLLLSRSKNAWSHASNAPYILMGAKRKYEEIFTFYVNKTKLKTTPSLNLVNQGKVRNKE